MLTPAVMMAALLAGPAQIPGTLNFHNVTAQRVMSTVPEAVGNEKEVGYGDFDHDNDLDVVVAVAFSDFGQRKNKLYINAGGTFVEVSGGSAISGFANTDVSRNALVRDYDADGWLDLIIVNDNNTAGDPGRTKIYMNRPVNGVFSSFVEEGLVRLGLGTGGAACGGYSFDADGDGDYDLYVGNYPGPSQDTMYFNNNPQNPLPGYFTNVTPSNVPIDSDYTVDVASADMNGDGTLDVLISNDFDPNYIYYNNNLGAGGGMGNFKYAGSAQDLGTASSESSMEPGDFDNDGDMDFYWSNRTGNNDQVYQQVGLDGANKAVFHPLASLPASTTVVSRKPTAADLNNDGRLDLIVMKEANAASRPTVLRNVTVGGAIEFIDWTPAPAFPSGDVHRGWHSAAFDTDADGRLDIFLGGFVGDHLFLNQPEVELAEGDLAGGVIPGVFNGDPRAVVGTANPGSPDSYTIGSLTAASFLSVVLHGPDDYLLEILDAADTVLASVDRGGAGVEEAVQYDPASMPSSVQLRVTVQACGNPLNVAGDCAIDTVDFLALLAAWGPNPGHPADFDGNGVVDTVDFLELLAGWGQEPYVLEVLARDG